MEENEMIYLRASSIHTFFLCPGKNGLSSKIEKTENNEYAELGTKLHLIASEYLKGETPDISDLSITETSIVFRYVNYIRERVQDGDYKVEKSIAKTSREIEDYFKTSFPRAFLLSGTPDLYCIKNDTLFVFDFKTGSGKFVTVENNYQLKTYAMLIYLSLEKTGELENVENIVLSIIQPSMANFQEIIYTKEELFKEFSDFINKIEKALKEIDNLVVGPYQCQYCDAIRVCPKIKEKVLSHLDLALKKEKTIEDEKELLRYRKIVANFREWANDKIREELLAGEENHYFAVSKKKTFRRVLTEEGKQRVLSLNDPRYYKEELPCLDDYLTIIPSELLSHLTQEKVIKTSIRFREDDYGYLDKRR